MAFNLVFASNTILSCFFFFLVIDVHFLIPEVTAHIFIAAAQVAIPTGIPTKEEKGEVETHPVTVEAKKSKCSV